MVFILNNLIGICICLVILSVFSSILGVWCLYRERKVKKRNRKLQSAFNKILSQKKSSEIRVGKIGENMAPFLKEWPFDPNRFRFLGNPVDGIQFTNHEIIFVEIKTGKSKLSRTQKQIKRLVQEGRVSFASFRVSQDGCSLEKVGG